MELTINVDDKESAFVIELLRKFSFVHDVRETATLARLDELWQTQAHKLFASPADYDTWLNTPNTSINDRSPISLLTDDVGYQTVRKLLGRLEHGIMA